MRTLPLLALVLLVACTDGGPSGDACDIGTSADQSAFDAAFSDMALVRLADGVAPDVDADRGPLFTADETVGALVTATAAADLVLCVRTRDGASDLVDSVTASLEVGEETIGLDSYGPGDYVVRVGLDDVLIQNLPFGVD